MKNMSAFEFWQVVNVTIQSVLLLAIFLGALYIGLKQYEINQQLVELEHQPSVEVAATDERIQIFNKGKHNIWLWGSETELSVKTLEKKPRLITPQGFYYIPLEPFKQSVLQRVGNQGEARINVDLFVSTVGDRKYVVKNIFYCTVADGKVTVHSQTVGITHEEWHST